MARFMRGPAFILSIVCAATVLGVPPAQAVDCVTEKQLFAADPLQLLLFNGHGSYTENMIRDANIDPSCDDGYVHRLRFSTAHSLAFNGTDFVEVGWWEEWNVDTGLKQWRVFWEYKIGQQVSVESISVSCCATSAFKTYKVSGTTWRGFYDRNADGSVEWQFGDISIPGMSSAASEAETGRRGNGSSYDHHNNLKYRDSNGVWHRWGDVAEDYDSDYSYHCHADSNYEYEFHTPDTRHTSSSANYCLV